MEDEIKEILEEWGIIKKDNNRHLQLYYDIKPLRMADKVLRYGKSFIEDFITIIKLKEERKIVRFIKRARSKLNQIIIADTFLNMRRGFQAFTATCDHKLMKMCTLQQEDCNIFIYPKKEEILSHLMGFKRNGGEP